MTADVKAMKKAAAEKAVDDYVKDGMVVGLGTGSTAYYAIKRVAQLVNENGYDLRCVATSLESERIARESGVTVCDLNEVEAVNVTIDGADEVDPKLNLIKGLGGALLREKIVAAATEMEVIVVDESKIVEKLGTKAPLPVEVLRFGHSKTAYALKRQGSEPVLRTVNGEPFVTDGGNYIYDCRFPEGIDSAFFKETAIDAIPGVVECGLFLNIAAVVVVAHSDGSLEVRN
jgi:ribose 5-phosphate isomerase A